LARGDEAPRAPWPPRDDRSSKRDETRRRQRRHTRLIAGFVAGGALLLVVSVALAYQLGKSNEPSSSATHEALGQTTPSASTGVSNLPTAPATTPPPISSPPKTKAKTAKSHTTRPAKKTPRKVTSKNPPGTLTTPKDTPSVGPLGQTATPPPSGGSLVGKVIVLDPGHNPGNGRYASEVNRPVTYDGVHTKPCDTTGTATLSGYPEYAYNWDVAIRVTAILRAEGAKVYLTRTATTPAWGPCIGDRAALGNKVHADAAVSIHGDGGPASGHGFESIVPTGPIPSAGLTSAMVANDLRLALALRAAFGLETGMVYSTYLGSQGIYHSNYYGGIDMSQVPKVLIETGNMRNDADAALMESAAWRQKAADGIALGITRFVRGA
jgi:N-acetylmuramoyl-L-alanine amidase